jgi:hypothetical protein
MNVSNEKEDGTNTFAYAVGIFVASFTIILFLILSLKFLFDRLVDDWIFVLSFVASYIIAVMHGVGPNSFSESWAMRVAKGLGVFWWGAIVLVILIALPFISDQTGSVTSTFNKYQTWYGATVGFGVLAAVTWWQLSRIENARKTKILEGAYISATVLVGQCQQHMNICERIKTNVLESLCVDKRRYDELIGDWLASLANKKEDRNIADQIGNLIDNATKNVAPQEIKDVLRIFNANHSVLKIRLAPIFEWDLSRYHGDLAPLGFDLMDWMNSVDGSRKSLQHAVPKDETDYLWQDYDFFLGQISLVSYYIKKLELEATTFMPHYFKYADNFKGHIGDGGSLAKKLKGPSHL